MGSVVGQGYKRVFWEKEEMQKCVINDHRLRNSVLFATNLDFDFKHLFQNNKFYDESRKINRNGSLIFARHKENKHYIDFNDTLNFVPFGVEVMAQKIGMKKLAHPACFGRKPQSMSERIEMEQYNINDSVITQQFASKMQNFFNTVGCKQKHTIASTGVDYWRRYGQPYDIFPERPEWVRMHYNGSLKGGRTECIKRGYAQDIHYYDFNSHYPARCFYGIDGKGSYPDPTSVKYTKKVDDNVIDSYEGITFLKLKAPYMYFPLIGCKFSGKLMFPYGEMSGWFTNIEIRKALKEGYEVVEYGEGLYYERNFIPFRNVVKTLYDLRRKFVDVDKDECFGQMCKTMMNSGLFGKFAQKLDGYEQEYCVDDTGIDEDGSFYITVNGKKVYPDSYNIRNRSVYCKQKTTKIPLFIMPILSSYTTALGRIKLWDDIKDRWEWLHYLDTDSAGFSRKCMESSKELGEMKLECVMPEAIFVRPKFYFANNGEKQWVKCKGVGRSLKTKEDFFGVFNNGFADTERFSKSKESAVRNIPFSSIIKVCKKISFEDDKRLWKGKFDPFKCGDSTPHHVMNGMTDIEKLLVNSKALDAFVKLKKSETDAFLNSDLFDGKSVGGDVSSQEFLDDERWWGQRGG